MSTRPVTPSVASDSATRLSLLGRLRHSPTDQLAWAEFVDRYGPRIYAWCMRWQAQAADAEEVTQLVLTKLVSKMHAFQYDPSGSFRAWLKTLTHHAWHDLCLVHARPGQGTGTIGGEQLASLEARDDLAERLNAEWEQQLMQEAMIRTRLRVAPATWQAFQLTALDGLSGAEAALRLKIPASQIFVYKFRVQKMLQEEVTRLDHVE